MRRPGARRISPAAQRQLAGDGAEQRGLAGAVGAGEAKLEAVHQRDADVAEDLAIAQGDGGVLDFDEALGLAAGGVEGDAGGRGARARFGILQLGDEGVGVVDAGFGFGGAGFGAAAEPLHLDADAIAETFLGALLPLDVRFAAFEKFGVAALDAEQAVGVDAVELDDLGGDVFEEIAVVSDDDKGERGGAEQVFEPLDAFEVEVVRGLVEEEDFGIGDDGFGNSKAFPPAAAEAGGFAIHAGIGGGVVHRQTRRGPGSRAGAVRGRSRERRRGREPLRRPGER